MNPSSTDETKRPKLADYEDICCVKLNFTEACFLIQMMIVSRSHEVSQQSKNIRKKLASELEQLFPGIIEYNYGEILLK